MGEGRYINPPSLNCGCHMGNSIISMKEVAQIEGAYSHPGSILHILFLIVVESDEWNFKVMEACCCCSKTIQG
jgi:hypothetical protein